MPCRLVVLPVLVVHTDTLTHRHTHAHVSAYLTIHIVSLSCLLNVFFLSLVIHIFLFLLLSFLLHLFLFYVLCFLLVVDVFVVALVFWACI